MRLDRLVSLGAVALSLALSFGACTKDNPNYCADADLHNCNAADAAAHENPDRAPGNDANEDVADAPVDAVKDTAPELKPPVCTVDNDCASKDAGAFACDTTDGGARCVECTANAHCKGAKPVCDTHTETCVACTGEPANAALECKLDSGKSVCAASAKSCVECVDNTKCGGTKPICDKGKMTCGPCTADSQCTGVGPGICVDWDGHCATNAEVVVLDRGGSCDATQSQFCLSGTAVAALSATRPILLVTGTMPVAAITLSGAAPNPVLIVGRGTASVGAGAGDMAGVYVSGVRKVGVRDLRVSGGTVGVLADGGADLRLTRSTIVGNGAGGVRTIGSSFVITNSIIAANLQGDATGGVTWAGARLGDLPAGGSGRFENNTVVDNKAVGVACSTMYDVTTDIIHGNIGGGSVNCGAATCCGAGDPDPTLDASYHLISGSPCVGKITATMMSVSVDIQGQPRPGVGGKLDCGADQLVP